MSKLVKRIIAIAVCVLGFLLLRSLTKLKMKKKLLQIVLKIFKRKRKK